MGSVQTLAQMDSELRINYSSIIRNDCKMITRLDLHGVCLDVA